MAELSVYETKRTIMKLYLQTAKGCSLMLHTVVISETFDECEDVSTGEGLSTSMLMLISL